MPRATPLHQARTGLLQRVPTSRRRLRRATPHATLQDEGGDRWPGSILPPWPSPRSGLFRPSRRKAAAVAQEHLAGVAGGWVPRDHLDQGNLEIWAADRGVLLLNTTLTVREGVAGSHRGMGWGTFTDQVIQHVEKAGPVFMLWGNEAQKKRKLLKDTPPEMIIESQHTRTAPFRGSKPFSRANEALSNAGREPIVWCLSKEDGSSSDS